jgi:hypothetical protein
MGSSSGIQFVHAVVCGRGWNVQQLAEQNFAAVTTGEWAAVCRHVKAVEEECMSRAHKMYSVMERIIINANEDDDDDDDDDNDDTSEATVI